MLQSSKGFTLIELIITVAIVGILAAIAYPSYQDTIRKSRRSDARVALLDLQMAQEKYRQNCAQYATAIANSYACVNENKTYNLPGNSTSKKGYYQISIVMAGVSAYMLNADPLGDQKNDTDCDPITLDQDGTGSPTACW